VRDGSLYLIVPQAFRRDMRPEFPQHRVNASRYGRTVRERAFFLQWRELD